MSHIVDSCPLTKVDGVMSRLTLKMIVCNDWQNWKMSLHTKEKVITVSIITSSSCNRAFG